MGFTQWLISVCYFSYRSQYPSPPLLNENGILPFISEECVNPGILPLLCMHSSHIDELREVLLVVSVTAEEPDIQLRGPGELQHLFGATLICLEITYDKRTNHSLAMNISELRMWLDLFSYGN